MYEYKTKENITQLVKKINEITDSESNNLEIYQIRL